MKIVRITKSYGQTVSKDYQTWRFGTDLVADVEIDKPEDLETQSAKLYDAARGLTLQDIEKAWKGIFGE